MKILLVRLDKIGDLCATLPVDQLQGVEQHEVHWVVSKAVEKVIQCSSPKRSYSCVDPNAADAAKQFREILKVQKPDMLVLFYGPWWVSFEAFKAGVKRRAGRRSQWHSYLFLNKGLRQARSQSLKHEADYNKELLSFALNLTEQKTPILKLQISESRRLLEKFQLSTGKYFVVHPGMAGSALNWPTEHYRELIQNLSQQHPVVISGTAGDKRYWQDLQPEFEHHPQVRWLIDQLSFEDLLRILKMSKAVVAPSTGVVHLAAGLDCPTVGIYSPVLAHSSKRWGPRGQHCIVLEPSSEQEAMSSISVEQVIHSVKQLAGD